jgi:putative ABC transport system substrate-binding protein
MKKTYKIIIILISIMILIEGLIVALKATQDKGQEYIPILQIVEHPALNETRRGIEETLLACCNIKVRYESAQGDALLAQQIALKIVNEQPKVIVAIGTIAAQSFLNKTNNIPIVFSSITDPLAAKLVKDLRKPGMNQTGVSNLIPIAPQFKLFKELLPNLKSIGFIYNQGEPNSLSLLKKIKESSKNLNIVVVPQVANSTSMVKQATESIIKNVDAIFISNDRTALSALSTIIQVAKQENKAVFVSDTDSVEIGALAALGPSQFEIGVKTVNLIKMILEGKDPAKIQVEYPDKLELVINLKAANKIGLKVPDVVLQRADKIIK